VELKLFTLNLFLMQVLLVFRVRHELVHAVGYDFHGHRCQEKRGKQALDQKRKSIVGYHRQEIRFRRNESSHGDVEGRIFIILFFVKFVLLLWPAAFACCERQEVSLLRRQRSRWRRQPRHYVLHLLHLQRVQRPHGCKQRGR